MVFLKKYGESIHATRGGPLIAPDEKKRRADEEHFALAEGKWWGGSRHNGDAIYLPILRWPAETVALPAIRRHFVQHSVLTGGNVEVRQPDAGIEMTVPAAQRHALNTIGKLPLDGPA